MIFLFTWKVTKGTVYYQPVTREKIETLPAVKFFNR